ncbi:MAG: hypothetical protein L3K24_17390, partial [Gammaproteobacteria bacterium]|nr:hypothetical protein [Gammaproteobacteria bacterium]
HDLAAPAMYAGKRVLVKKGALPSKHPAQFQRVQLMKAVVDREWCVRLPNGASVLFSAAVDAATLAVVLNTTADLK